MDTTDYLQHYYGICERHEGHMTGMLGEPLNAISSMGFMVVAIMLFRYYNNHTDLKNKRIWDIHFLTGVIFAIGIGSLLFHSFPSPTTELMDITTIVIFILVYFGSVLFRIAKCNWFQAMIAFMAFAGTTHILVSLFPNAMNDSIGYLSTMGALIMIALFLNMKRRASARAFLLASLIGVLSLFFRGIDNAICDVIPFGSHFMWHTLNSILIYILMIQLIRNVNRKARLIRDAKQRWMKFMISGN